jgi:4-hydroxy-2-oxoheptanedioate aldolase
MLPRIARRFNSTAAASTVRHNRFKAAINAGQHQIGFWTGLKSSLVAEMISFTSGFDWFVIDMEHSPNEIGDVLVQLQASQSGHAEPMVRVPWNEQVTVKRVRDLGAQSILFPYVQNADEARAAVAAVRYPPDGIRGVMSLQRMNMYGAQNPHYYKECGAQVCTVLQIETIEAIKNIPEIGAVDGVDALFIGPSDLAASLGHVGNPAHPEVRSAIEEGIRLGKATGKPVGFLSANRDDCRWVLEQGVTFCAVGSDVALLANTTRAIAKDFKDFCGTLD